MSAHGTWLELAIMSWKTFAQPLRAGVPESGVPLAPQVRPGVVNLFVERLRDSGARLDHVSTDEISAATLPDGVRPDAVVDHATLGVATAGAVVLDGPRHPSPEGRATGPATTPATTPVRTTTQHVCILHVSTVVLGVPEAVALLDPHRYHTWLRGAGADPDLELDRVGPAWDEPDLHVLLVG